MSGYLDVLSESCTWRVTQQVSLSLYLCGVCLCFHKDYSSDAWCSSVLQGFQLNFVFKYFFLIIFSPSVWHIEKASDRLLSDIVHARSRIMTVFRVVMSSGFQEEAPSLPASEMCYGKSRVYYHVFLAFAGLAHPLQNMQYFFPSCFLVFSDCSRQISFFLFVIVHAVLHWHTGMPDMRVDGALTKGTAGVICHGRLFSI